MTTIVTRAGKGSSLSWTEVDANFTNLNTDKAEINNPTFTGIVSGITSTMVGLGNVDNTSDATKNAASATLTNKTITASTNIVEAISGPNNSPISFRNKLINGEVTRINQRGVANWAAVSNGNYGYDRWKKIDASNMTQIIEAGNFRPSTVHTLSGVGVTTQQITSPASGNWTLPNIPITATNVQVEEGLEATPFEVRHIGFELALCQRYYFRFAGECISQCVSTTLALVVVPFPVQMRTAPVQGTAYASGSLTNSAGSPVAVASISGATSSVNTGRFSAGVVSGLVGGNAAMYTGGDNQWSAEIP